MRSIGGGVVRYRGIAWIECPDRPDIVGECTTGGAVEVLWNGQVMESFWVRVGDPLLVADGATIAPGTWLVEHAFSRRVRADLPPGGKATVRWSDAPVVGATDAMTGLVRMEFSFGDDAVTLELVDEGGRVLVTREFFRSDAPMAKQGDIVSRGDILAIAYSGRFNEGMSGIEALRDFLNGRVGGWGRPAAITPCDGRVEAIEPACVAVRGVDGNLHRVRRSPGQEMRIREGNDVRAGDALEDGQRSHHHLLRVWGEDRLARHMVEELEIETARRSLSISRAYWSLVVRAMLGWRRVLDPGGTGLRRHRILSRQAFDRGQREATARGFQPATAAPVLRGITAMAREKLGDVVRTRNPRSRRGR